MLPYRIRVPLQAIKKSTKPSTADMLTEETWTAAKDPNYLRMILTSKVYDMAVESPLQFAGGMSESLKNSIYFKREDLQPGFSFKIRGAYNKLANLTTREKARGVVSYGSNNAHSVAMAAQKLGIKATLVIPTFVRGDMRRRLEHQYGADIVVAGTSMAEAEEQCFRLAEENDQVMVSPYDDPLVIAGQGTIGLEIINQFPARQPNPYGETTGGLDAIFVCVGGGGMISGIASYVKEIDPSIQVIGVQAEGADAMTQSLEAGGRIVVAPEELSTFAENSAVRMVGEECFRVCDRLVDGMVIVNNDELCAAVENTFEETRSMLEPAGALAVAGMRKWVEDKGAVGLNLVGITSGANMVFDRLRFVADRALIGQRKEALLSVSMAEEPGSFKRLYSMIYPRAVTEFSYRYSAGHTEATVFLCFQMAEPGSNETQVLLEQLQMAGINAMDLTGDEMAKAHARYLSGGRAGQLRNEVLYRFEFPEKPGALKVFLDTLPDSWNVTLFHYRSHGADKGKVLVGFTVPEEEQDSVDHFLGSLNYPFVEETENPVYKKFLA